MIRRAPRRMLGLATAAAVLAAAGCSASAATDTRLYAYRGNPLFAAAALLRDNGHQREAAELTRVAQAPAAYWAAGQPGEMQVVRKISAAAARKHETPVFVAYDLPDRDACGKYSSSGGTTPAAYEVFIRQLAAALGPAQSIVIVEPDAVPDIVRGCLSPALRAQRYRLLRYAMAQLSAHPGTRVYLDAGNPGEFADPVVLARPLERAGVTLGRGFSANVANFQWTSLVAAWSRHLERVLPGRAQAVIDTSRNGRGPYTGPASPQWCNPPGRALGLAPTLNPGLGGIDALLWVKDPGASDGRCNGGPAAGTYWPQYALALERASRDR